MPAKLQHYVPRFYLEEFADPEKSTNIWVYQKGEEEPRSQGIKGTAAETHYYAFEGPEGEKDQRLEQAVLGTHESMAAPVIRRWLKERRPAATEDDLRALTPFLATLHVRSPRMREDSGEMFATMARQMAKESVSDESKAAEFLREHPDLNCNLDQLREAVEAAQDPNRIKINVNRNLLICLPFLITNDIAPFIAGRIASLLIAPNEIDFVTSDSPLSVFRLDADGTALVGVGIGQPRADLTLPLSPRLALRLSLSEIRPRRHLSVAETREINRRTACQAARYVYAHRRSKRIERLVQEFSFTLKEPRVDSARIAGMLRANRGERIPPED